MPTRTVYTYTCPRCRTDLGRQFSLLTSKRIVCPGCGNNVRIDTNVIQQNWGYNFAWVGGLLIWGGLAAGVLLDPAFAASVGNNTLPATTPGNRLVIAGFCCIPALIGGLLVGGFGLLLGTIVAAGADDEPPAEKVAPPSQGPSYAAAFNRQAAPEASQPPGPRPRKRSLLVRGSFVLLWPVVFLFGAAIVLGMVTQSNQTKVETPPPVAAASTVALLASPHGQAPLLTVAASVSDDAKAEYLKQQAVEKRGEKSAPWLVLGMLVVFALGCLGWMPSTSAKLAQQAPPEVPTTRSELTLSGKFDLKKYPIAIEPEPKPRNGFVRAFFMLFWPSVFFIAAALTMSAVAGGFSAENEAVQKQIGQQSAQQHVGWIVLGTLVLFILGCVGLLPWTGRSKRRSGHGAA